MLDDGLLCLFNCWLIGGLDFVIGVVGCRRSWSCWMLLDQICIYKTVDDVQRNYFQSPLKSIFGYVVAVGISSSLYKITSTTLSSLLITTYWALLFKIVIYNKHYT